jgi:WD40 repeat protein
MAENNEIKEKEKPGNPYKGLFSYEEKDARMFYGRNRERKNLFKLVNHNFLTVIFGKSGIGKTSLINAGLFPALREGGFLPIRLRPDYSPAAPPLSEQVHETISAEIEKHRIIVTEINGGGEATPLRADETLWEYFHRVRHMENVAKGSGDPGTGKEIVPVLVFDQFEEVFTLGRNHRDTDAFLDELYFLVENQFPDSIKKRMADEADELVYTYRDVKPHVRVIVSLREDYLPHLNSLKTRIPSITGVTFRVLHLDGRQGREIIGMPGGIRDEHTIRGILRMFYPEDIPEGEEIADEKLEIEPSILSLLCFQLLEKEDAGLLTGRDRDRILADFYDSVAAEFPPEVETFVESKLLTEGGFRTPFYLERTHPLKESIDKLEDRRVLRKVHYGEKEYVEIIHDVLAPVIREKRNKRLAEKRKRELQEELKKRNKKIINRVVVIAGIVSVILAFYAFVQKNRADRHLHEAVVNNLVAEASLQLQMDHVGALRIAEAAYREGLPDPPPNALRVLNASASVVCEQAVYKFIMHHDKPVPSAEFSPDNTRILTASWDRTAKLWDLQGNLLKEFEQNDGIRHAEFSPEGTRILTASWDKTASIWDLNGNCLLKLEHNDFVKYASFSPDSTRVITGADDGTVTLWDSKGTLLETFKAHGGIVNTAVFSPGGSRILTASADRTAKLWDVQGRLLKTYPHEEAVNSAVFSPESSRVLTASADHTARIWDVQGNLLRTFTGHKAPVRSAVFVTAGTLFTTSDDRTAKLWNLEGNLLADFNMHEGPVLSARVSPDGKWVLTASQDGTARLWNLEKNLLKNLVKPVNQVRSAVFSPDSARILTASMDKTAGLFDLKGNLVMTIGSGGHTDEVNSAVFSPGGTRILTASKDRTAKLWDLQGNRLADFAHAAEVKFALFSPDGTRILTVLTDHTVKLWNVQGRLLADLNRHTGEVNTAVFSPDGTAILTASDDRTARLWDSKGNPLVILKKHTGWVSSAFFSPQGDRIITASDDGTAILWDLAGNDLNDFTRHTDSLTYALFSPDGTKVLTASADYTARLWDLEGNLLMEFRGHGGWVTSAAFSPDGMFVLTASRDHTARLWDLSGNFLAEYRHNDELKSASFSPDGAWILTVSADGVSRLWYTPQGVIQWLETADIPQLSKEEKKRLSIRPEEK